MNDQKDTVSDVWPSFCNLKHWKELLLCEINVSQLEIEEKSAQYEPKFHQTRLCFIQVLLDLSVNSSADIMQAFLSFQSVKCEQH